MHHSLMLWHADHVNFGRLLNILEGELRALHDARSPDYRLMLDIMYYMTHYSDLLHHPKEDLMFARLKTRDANVGPTIAELTTQHAQMRDMGEEMVRALDDVLNGSIASREHVEATSRAYISAFRAHIRTEEAEILPSAGQLLTESDWNAIDSAIANVEDPLFGSHIQERYAGLREQINRQAQANRATPS